MNKTHMIVTRSFYLNMQTFLWNNAFRNKNMKLNSYTYISDKKYVQKK